MFSELRSMMKNRTELTTDTYKREIIKDFIFSKKMCDVRQASNEREKPQALVLTTCVSLVIRKKILLQKNFIFPS